MPLGLEDQQLIATARVALPAKKRDQRSADEQLSYVLAHPEDDDAKLVLADALQEVGDPRGELITLQFLAETQKLSREQKKREKQILSDHFHGLVGPLAPIVLKRDLLFKRGFLYAYQLKDNLYEEQWRDAVDSELLGTVFRLLDAPLPLVMSARLVALRQVGVSYHDPALLGEFLGRGAALPWTQLGIYLSEQTVAHLVNTARLPAVTELSLRGHDELQRKVAESRLGRQVHRLTLEDHKLDTFGQVAGVLLSTVGTQLETVSTAFGGANNYHIGSQLVLNWDGERYLVSLYLDVRGGAHPLNTGGHMMKIARALQGLSSLPLSGAMIGLAKKVKEPKMIDVIKETLYQNIQDPGLIIFDGQCSTLSVDLVEQ